MCDLFKTKMLNSNYPSYIIEILHGLSTDKCSEEVLLKWADLINRDVALFDIYSDLGYDLETRNFKNTPDAAKAAELIKTHYDDQHIDYIPLKFEENSRTMPVDESSLSTAWTEDHDLSTCSLTASGKVRSVPKSKGLR
jgi:hypothetical protein